jgi:Pyruvate/2-oxoacid:ferredoxin oxidoreductase delta subunit
LGIVDWREDCAGCHNCVKRACVYGLYREEADTLRDEVGYLDYIYQCKGCLNCIQNCTKNILTRVVNPEYRRLGDEYFTPEIILATWFQADTGRIPVSGSGYGGPFSGAGFDSMWTDMSEIVRPTRDGIHGREYINTSVDIGRKLPYLALRDGRLSVAPPPLMEIPLPVIFDCLPAHWQRGAVPAAVVRAAAALGTLAVVRQEDLSGDLEAVRKEPLSRWERAGVRAACENTNQLENLSAKTCPHPNPLPEGEGTVGGPLPDRLLAAGGHIIPLIPLLAGAAAGESFAAAPLVMVPDCAEIAAVQAALKAQNQQRIVMIRLPASPASAGRVLELVHQGAEVIHLVFDAHGREGILEDLGEGDSPIFVERKLRQSPERKLGQSPERKLGQSPAKPRHARDVLREVHRALVKDGTRDQVTLVASGGIALAEHLAKAIICGADLVAVDIPLLLALECRLCGECLRGEICPIDLDGADADFAVHRIVNLLGAWHQQLIEVLGAMGIREVRRLRGETGRAMFFEDLERETFGRLFGKRVAF